MKWAKSSEHFIKRYIKFFLPIGIPHLTFLNPLSSKRIFLIYRGSRSSETCGTWCQKKKKERKFMHKMMHKWIHKTFQHHHVASVLKFISDILLAFLSILGASQMVIEDADEAFLSVLWKTFSYWAHYSLFCLFILFITKYH